MLNLTFWVIIVNHISDYIPVFHILLTAFDYNVLLIPIYIMNKSFMIYWEEHAFHSSIMIKERFLSRSIR